MQANPRSIIALFEPTQRYIVPMFQRHYVWTRERQWTPLWEDIAEKLKERQTGVRPSPHFLGAVILDSARSTSTRQVSRFIVIDGQQRLTTFQLLLAALRDAATSKGLTHVARATERCLFNPDIELMEKPEEEQYKLWPTLVNRKVFCQVISAGSPEKVIELFPFVTLPRKRKPQPRENLAEAYEFFCEKIEKACDQCDSAEAVGDLLINLLGVLRDDFTVVEIILGEADNSQEIFNSLNAFGEPLSQSDLLRSYLFMRAEKNEANRDHLYNTYWSRFESTWWDEQTTRGNQTSSRLDTFTRTLLSAKLGIPIDVRRVHAAYTNWIKEASPYETLEDELREFTQYAAYFEQLSGNAEGPLTEFGNRMRVWETSTVFPLVIYLAVEGSMVIDELLRSMALIEGFIVRRAICGLQSKEYNKFFVEIISRFQKLGVSYSSLQTILAAGEGDTRRFPTDAEFAADWKSKPLYGRLTSGQIALMMSQLEAAIRSTRAESTVVPSISVEHVMPQEWTTNYLLAGEAIPKAMNGEWFVGTTNEEKASYERLRPLILQRRSLLHSIGNLTAVTQPLNAAMKNSGFRAKKLLLKESILALNRYFDSIPEWDEQAIQARAEHLFTKARSIWCGPSVPQP